MRALRSITASWIRAAVTVEDSASELPRENMAAESKPICWQSRDQHRDLTLIEITRDLSLLPSIRLQTQKFKRLENLCGISRVRKMSSSKGPVIVITGTPGTGKSTHAQILAQESPVPLKHINVGDLVKEKNLYEEFDSEWQSHIVDEDKVRSRVFISCIWLIPPLLSSWMNSNLLSRPGA